MKGAPSRILITIDVEDWFQVENLRPWFPPSSWDGPAPRVVDNTRRLLDLFDRASEGMSRRGGSYRQDRVRATFFVLGWVAERFPALVRDIHQRGHEVASHGYSHRLCGDEKPDRLRSDLSTSKKLLEDITGEPVLGYRAPSFSISPDVLKMIEQAGYRYDASYNSFGLNARYGKLSLDPAIREGIAYRVAWEFHEIPISNLSFLGRTLPWGGGGYFRLLPWPLFKLGVKAILKKERDYMFYMHPWEIDPGQPRIMEASRLSRFRHYTNLDRSLGRLSRMLSEFEGARYMSCAEYLGLPPSLSTP